MKPKVLQKAVFSHLIHFESEGMNYFENPFSSDLWNIDCSDESKQCWHTSDPSTSDKPLTVVLDLEAVSPGEYTGRVKGFYLLDECIGQLKTFEGDHGFNGNIEYYALPDSTLEIIEEIASPLDEVSFGYKEGFKEKILECICSAF